jgi:hypothetical protein
VGLQIFQPRAEGRGHGGRGLRAGGGLARWTEKQARAARLLCAECDYDLGQRDDEERLPYNILLPEKPNKLRLVCGRCCNHGLDEMELWRRDSDVASWMNVA